MIALLTIPLACCMIQPVEVVNMEEHFVQAKQTAPDPDEGLIERLLEIVKDKSLPPDQRANACQALGKRGVKAKRAVPAMVKFLDATLAQGRDESGNWPAGTKGRVAKIADGLGNIGPDAKLAVPHLEMIFFKGIAEQVETFDEEVIYPLISYDHVDVSAAEALGKIGGKEAYDVLTKAARSEVRDIRRGAARGFGYLARGGDADLKEKAMIQLRAIYETDAESTVQSLAGNVLTTIIIAQEKEKEAEAEKKKADKSKETEKAK